MRQVAVVTDAEHPGLRPDDVPLDRAFRGLDREVVPVPWGAVIEAGAFELVLVRSPWDYFLRPEAFLGWIDALEAPVVNAPAVLRWNHDKRYLVELAERGAGRIPRTAMLGADERPARADELLARVDAGRAVVKPVVSAGAHRTRVVREGDGIEWTDEDVGAYFVQEFVDAVVESGEWSLVFLGGEYSHAVRKTATPGDFRVQEEFGGAVLVEEPSAATLAAARDVLVGVPGGDRLAYARVDLVEDRERGPLLMELELIEPELFLRSADGAATKLARAALRSAGA